MALMKRYFYGNTLSGFLEDSPETILGILTGNNTFSLEPPQRNAWESEIIILKEVFKDDLADGMIYLEYSIPRLGRRIDAVVIIESVIFVLEFKVGAYSFERADVDQVWDYALDLKNFHETSHDHYIAPVLISTNSDDKDIALAVSPDDDKTLAPICTNSNNLQLVFSTVRNFFHDDPVDPRNWVDGRYCPTPTIIEAATALYNNHTVENISRSDAGAINLSRTSKNVSEIISESRASSRKSICFVTGVPGAGKTLVGLNIATTHLDKDSALYSVFLSGNGPLVRVLREALVRDRVEREKAQNKKVTKKRVGSEVKMFIQNVHNFRDDCLIDENSPPIEHVALFDEAQRAWSLEQTTKFMASKKKIPDFNKSEPDFLISCLDRHSDWAVVVCLVGGGQEINTGEGGIGEWVDALQSRYKDWHIWLSGHLTDTEYGAGEVLDSLSSRENVHYSEDLHLAVSLRSFRAEKVSLLVKQILDREMTNARQTLSEIKDYPILLTRDLKKAKDWLKNRSRGSERYGIVVSSQAARLKPHAIDIRPKIDPIHWFLNGKEDTRSSYYLEDVATEFDVQGLELDWACVTWDADLRHTKSGWVFKSFKGCKWQNINQKIRQKYLLNAYRVLLTRARQGMVIVVPQGTEEDPTRSPKFYDSTYKYLQSIGFPEL